jgi:hypothetical protein
MTDELADLLARARQLERENASLRSMQSPGGDDVGLRGENAMLRQELELLRAAPAALGASPDAPVAGDTSRAAAATASTGSDQAGDEMPRTLADFNALPSARREHVARSMTRRQRDELLGRNCRGGDERNYL